MNKLLDLLLIDYCSNCELGVSSEIASITLISTTYGSCVNVPGGFGDDLYYSWDGVTRDVVSGFNLTLTSICNE